MTGLLGSRINGPKEKLNEKIVGKQDNNEELNNKRRMIRENKN